MSRPFSGMDANHHDASFSFFFVIRFVSMSRYSKDWTDAWKDNVRQVNNQWFQWTSTYGPQYLPESNGRAPQLLQKPLSPQALGRDRIHNLSFWSGCLIKWSLIKTKKNGIIFEYESSTGHKDVGCVDSQGLCSLHLCRTKLHICFAFSMMLTSLVFHSKLKWNANSSQQPQQWNKSKSAMCRQAAEANSLSSIHFASNLNPHQLIG